MIVGDAFTLPSRNPSYYRDLFFSPPFFLFSIGGVLHLLAGGSQRTGIEFLAIAVVCVLLARERLVLIGGVLLFCFVRLLFASFIAQNARVWLITLLLGAAIVALFPAVRNYRPSYERPKGLTILGVLVLFASLSLTLMAAYKLSH